MDNISNIYKEMHQHLGAFIKKRVNDDEVTRDILQEVFIKIQHNIGNLKNKEKLTAWIFQITRNTINDFYRQRQRDQLQDLGTHLSDTMEKQNIGIGETHQQLSQCVLMMIDILPEKYKTALYLTEIEGISQKELAKKLNISYSGAKSRVQRGKEKLKNLFLECCDIKTDKYGNVIDFKSRKKRC